MDTVFVVVQRRQKCQFSSKNNITIKIYSWCCNMSNLHAVFWRKIWATFIISDSYKTVSQAYVF